MRLLTATEVVNFSLCRHIETLRLAGVAGAPKDASAALIARKGDIHEDDVAAATPGLVTIERRPDDRRRQAAETLAAMRAGAPVIRSGYFLSDALGLQGEADFLLRIDRPSQLGPWSYEVKDAKKSKRLKPQYALQLCHYSALIEELQGVAPEHAYIHTGDGRVHAFRLSESRHYHAALVEMQRAFLTAPEPTYPLPIGHCKFCQFREHCDATVRADDDVTLTAGIKNGQALELRRAGIKTVAALGALVGNATPIPGIGREALDRLARQARAQNVRDTLVIDADLLDELPPLRTGDLYFDMESYPYFDGGPLEYLFGFLRHDPGAPHAFTLHFGPDRAGEKRAFEAAARTIIDALAADPETRIFHYAPYEKTHMAALASRYGVYEEEINAAISGERFVDLFRVVRKALILPTESYSLKAIEPLMGFARRAEIGKAMDSIVLFDTYLETQDETRIDAIKTYNEDDLLATRALHQWLLGVRDGQR